MQVAAVVASGPLAPALRVRAIAPARALAEYGIVVNPVPLFSEGDYARFQQASLPQRGAISLAARRQLVDRFDGIAAEAVIVHRQADLFPSLRVERSLAEGRRLIYDVDDAIWLSSPGLGGGHPLGVLKGSRRKARWLSSHADHVIAGNEILAEWLSRYARQVTVVPSLVDPARIQLRHHNDGETLTLGWIGSQTTARYLARLEGVFEQVALLLPERSLEVLVVGGQGPTIPGVTTTSIPWSEIEEARALQRMDIGLMPLPDNQWTRGKCAFKALQYMAAGVPVVADDVGVSASVVEDGKSGLIVRREEAWVEAVRTLGCDLGLRTTMGLAGRDRVERHFSVKRWAPTLAKIIGGRRRLRNLAGLR